MNVATAQPKVGRFEISVILACAAAVFFDGFDAQAIGYVAPNLIKDLHLAPGSLGPVFSAGLVGIMLGALFIAPTADRFGRRPIILLSILLFAALTLATAFANSINQLLLLRFLTGLGLGGCMPNAIALTAEYCPSRLRGFLVTLMFNGFTLGSIFGGVLAYQWVPTHGWRVVFIAGGVLPLLLLPILYFALPESIRFLILNNKQPQLVQRLLRRMGTAVNVDLITKPISPVTAGGSVKELFGGGRARKTLVLWIVFFMSLLDLYLLVNWLPTILNQAGTSVSTAVLLGTLLQVGGIIGTVALGAGLDRVGATAILVPAYLIGALSVAAIGLFSGSHTLITTLAVVMAGFGIIGGQTAANAVAASAYPTEMRSTGVGWALGIGRIGSIIGPLLASLMVLAHIPSQGIFLMSAIPALLAALAAAFYAPWRVKAE